MILAAGLTPVWQQILTFDRFTLGEVNRAATANWCASGKVLNVGMAVHTLGAPCRVLCPAGGPSGESIIGEFTARGIDGEWIATETSTRVCTTLIDNDRQQITELVENAAALADAELQQYFDAYTEAAATADVVVLTGSLPTGTPSTYYRDLLTATSCPAILDARGPELLAALEHRPLLIKPNREELAITTKRELHSEQEVWDAMKKLIALGAQWVLVSQGSEDLLLTDGSQRFRLTPPTVPVVNSIGCGDCLAAGIAWGVSREQAMPDAVRLGIAAAAVNLRQLLPAQLEPATVDELASQVSCHSC